MHAHYLFNVNFYSSSLLDILVDVYCHGDSWGQEADTTIKWVYFQLNKNMNFISNQKTLWQMYN